METQPASQQSMIDQGFEHLQASRYEDAVDIFTTCLTVYPNSSRAALGRAISRFQLKDWKTAEEDFKKVSELDPKELEGRVGRGMSLAMQGEVYPALEVLEKLIADFPTFVRGYIQLGLLQVKLGAIVKGREYLQQALKLRPLPAERQFIESSLKEQEKLDEKRYYRPDFETLRKENKK